MDKVLSRPLFAKKYFEYHGLKPVVKKYQTGGIASLSPKEKAIYAATFAAPLLKATQAPGESMLGSLGRAIGEGVEKLPATILAIEKQKGTGQGVRTLNDAELQSYNLPKGTVAQIDAEGKITVVSKPTAEELKERRGYQRTRNLLGDIAKDYIELDRPVGYDPRRAGAALFGKYTKSEFAKRYNAFKTKIDQATIFLTQAISGAQVSDQERERIKELIPQVGDTETVFEAKLQSLEKYLGAASKIAENTNVDISTAFEVLEGQGGVSQFIDFNLPINYTVDKGVIDLTKM